MEEESRKEERTTIVDGELEQVSVSAIACFDPKQRGGCNRRFHYKYVQGLEEPTGKAAAKGQDTHAEIKAWGDDFVEPKDKLAKKAVEWFRKNRFWELYSFEVPVKGEVAGVKLIGMMDAVSSGNGEVLDWKTTSKDIEELPHGVSLIFTIQMPGYGKMLLNAIPRADKIRLTHVYLSDKYEPVEVTKDYDREIIEERFQEIEEVVEDMKRVIRLPIEEVKPNEKSCDAFGGCYYRNICHYGRGVTSMGMMDKLREAKKTVTNYNDEPKILPDDAPVSMATEPAQVEEVVETAQAVEPKRRGRPPKAKTEEPKVQDTSGETYFKGKFKEIVVSKTENLGDFNNVKLGLVYEIEEGDQRAAARYVKHEVDELVKFFKEGE